MFIYFQLNYELKTMWKPVSKNPLPQPTFSQVSAPPQKSASTFTPMTVPPMGQFPTPKAKPKGKSRFDQPGSTSNDDFMFVDTKGEYSGSAGMGVSSSKLGSDSPPLLVRKNGSTEWGKIMYAFPFE